MKILLIASNTASTPYPIYPLGLSMVAAALRNGGHEVCQFDFLQNNKSMGALCNAIGESTPDIIGVSIRNIDNVKPSKTNKDILMLSRILCKQFARKQVRR